MSAPDPTGRSLLVLIDPAARRADGEAVRIARDVLCAAAATKICLPESAAELERALARTGGRRPVVIGDDRAFLQVVGQLRRQDALDDAPLSMVPVGGSLALARALGVPTGTVAAARAVLDGEERRLGLLVDDGGGVVLDALRLPAGGLGGPAAGSGRLAAAEGLPASAAEGPQGVDGYGPAGRPGPGGAIRRWSPAGLRALAARAVGRRSGDGRRGGVASGAGADAGRLPAAAGGGGWGPAAGGAEGAGWGLGAVEADGTAWELDAGLDADLDAGTAVDGTGWESGPQGACAGNGDPFRLRVEADGVLLADLDAPVAQIQVAADPASGLAHVVVRPREGRAPVRTEARSVRVWGSDFRYRADAVIGGPVRQRTWTACPGSWRLITAPSPGGR